MKEFVRSVVQEVLEAEMDAALGATKGERTDGRLGYRSEKALVSTLTEMYVQGVSTRKVQQITEELCAHSFSASSISAMVKRLDEHLEQFAHRSLEESYPYLIPDARDEKASWV